MVNKFVFLPPQTDLFQQWIPRLLDSAPSWKIVAPETQEQAAKELKDADAAFGTMNPELIAAAPNLRWLQAPAAAPAAGYYFDELIAHPTKVTNFREIYNDHISVQILGYIINFTKHFNVYRDKQKERKYEALETPHHDIFLPESTVLIVGVGGIGSETARLCKAIGMRVLGIDGRREDKPEWVDDMFSPDQLDDQLPHADFVVLTIPHTPSTEGLFDSTKFVLMKNSAIFINIGRGMTTKLHDLNNALRSGQIGGAGLDVYEIEPLPEDHPLWDAPNTILTPHTAALGGANLDERRYEIVVENFRNFSDQKPLRNEVDKANWF
ncbi:MAG: D-2-hydroxyacid dehydrogenase [SAR202 cluster bacterium]|nr:hydroxyacid dehydrogenase [Chloroflexota bacterium]MQG88635.1 D-2-hydroxyacid dehydrogenase [SAR202 cluster bacterium]|tara:strand:- start:1212 stop:2183 length:972 start_codon:yes stop_codon:yes gene_type:complete